MASLLSFSELKVYQGSPGVKGHDFPPDNYSPARLSDRK